MIVLGVDPSIAATAMCAISPGGVQFEVSKTPPAAGTIPKHDRLSRQAGAIVAASARADVTLMEGPSFASKGNATRDLAGLWWMTFDRLRLNGLPLAIVPPATLKKWITGRGNADKFAVGQAVAKRWPGVNLRSHDEADALVLASIGLHALDALPWRPTAFQLEQLSKVEWIKWPGDRAGTENRHAS